MSFMPSAELWPGQVDRAIFTLAQVRALSSVVRSEVFWAFSAFEPRSTNEVATAIRRTSPTVRYHVNELLKADMLIAVETRKKRSRIEEAYVHKMVRGYTPAPPELADEEWGSEDESDDGIAIHVVGYFAPTIMESQLHYKKLTGQDLAHRNDEEE
jgi:hypothetical protein